MNDLADILVYTKKMTLLYVENDEQLRKETFEVLNDFFLEIIIAFDGQDGLDKFYNFNIDIIITDIEMPRLNGLEMAESILEYDENIPIVISSGDKQTKYFISALEMSLDGYLFKPLEVESFFKILKKIIKKIKSREDLNNSLAFLHQYQELTDGNIAVSKTDTKGIISYVNEEFCNFSGYSKEELIGSDHNILRHQDTPASIYVDLWHRIKYEKEQWRGILKNKKKNGKVFYIDLSIQPILDTEGNIVEYISIRKDVSGMMNPKKQLFDLIESSSDVVLILIKTDEFLDIEKFYGYKLSQEIEENFANTLFDLMPKYLGFDKFLALGGGEYIFIQDVKKNSQRFILSIVEDLKALQKQVNTLKIDVSEVEYDISIMISVSSGEKCIENANYGIQSLERSKQDFIIANNFAKKEQEIAENNLNVLKMIKKALDTSNIISHFQPIVSNATKEIVKYESLVRLVTEEGEIITPYFFLDIAKKGKYYAQITGRVLENSFKALSKTDKCITINISALDIEKPSTQEKIFELLESHKESDSRIVFELLEDEEVRDIAEISQFITKVKKYGVRIAIDDFGAGYSNFERLLKYQPDILKIDGSLIKNIETDSYSLSVVKTIVAFAKEQSIELVAEYIENENIYHILNNLGVEYSQGYYFGKPNEML